MKAKKPTPAQRARWEQIRELGCIAPVSCELRCSKHAVIHHIETGAGGRQDHDRVIPLCWDHHDRMSPVGLHSGRRKWQEIFGTEQELLEKVDELLKL
jgi:hypothetical protein